MLKALSLGALLFLALPLPSLPPLRPMVITWGGNSPDWNQALQVSAVRMGCSDAPLSCAQSADKLAASENVSSILISILLNLGRFSSDAAAYAALAHSHPVITEIGFDDFVTQARKTGLSGSELSALLQDAAGRWKGASLRFGITLYQDEFTSGALDSLQLSDGARQSVDSIHLFPHYRKESRSLADTVRQAQKLFPNAKVILGSYAYDRREYLPCQAGNSSKRCSIQEELQLFQQNLQQEIALIQSGAAVGLEFFPGSFGQEDSWKGWDNPRACKAGGRAECIQTTLAMREKVRELLSGPFR
jgi:hypothetical protein